MHKAVAEIKRIKQLYDQNHIAAYSAQGAFFMLLSAVPVVVLTLVVWAALTDGGTNSGAGRLHLATQQLTGATSMVYGRGYLLPLLSVTGVLLMWAATKGVRALAKGIAIIYHHQKKYNIVQLVVRSVVFTFGAITLLWLSFGVLVLTQPLQQLLTAVAGQKVSGVISTRNIWFFLWLTLLFAVAYATLAKSDIAFGEQFAGAAVAAAGWIVYSFGFSVYIRHFAGYSVLYGGFGAVMLFMLWLYMCVNIFMCGALFNKIRKDGRKM